MNESLWKFQKSFFVNLNILFTVEDVSNEVFQAFPRSRLARLSLEDRRNLCAEARKFVTLVFLGREVAEGQMYQFEYSPGQMEGKFSVSCPTSPKLYIHQGNSESEVKLTLVRGLIDSYIFEVEDLKPALVSKSRLQSYVLGTFYFVRAMTASLIGIQNDYIANNKN
mgnify:CR=1 FL=1